MFDQQKTFCIWYLHNLKLKLFWWPSAQHAPNITQPFWFLVPPRVISILHSTPSGTKATSVKESLCADRSILEGIAVHQKQAWCTSVQEILDSTSSIDYLFKKWASSCFTFYDLIRFDDVCCLKVRTWSALPQLPFLHRLQELQAAAGPPHTCRPSQSQQKRVRCYGCHWWNSAGISCDISHTPQKQKTGLN